MEYAKTILWHLAMFIDSIGSDVIGRADCGATKIENILITIQGEISHMFGVGQQQVYRDSNFNTNNLSWKCPRYAKTGTDTNAKCSSLKL